MKSRIETAFPHSQEYNCIKIDNSSKLYIEDLDGVSCFYKGDSQILEHPYFTIENFDQKDIHLVCVDCCLYNDNTYRRCDFAVFDNTKICFVELKKGRMNEGSAGDQLRVTLNHFKTQKILEEPYILEACLCVGYKTRTPKVSASNQNLAVEFWDDFKVELTEGSQMSF